MVAQAHGIRLEVVKLPMLEFIAPCNSGVGS